MDSRESLLSREGCDGVDVRNGEDLTLSVIAADHGRQLDIGVRNAVEAVQVLRGVDRRLSHVARSAYHGAVPRARAAVVHYHEVDRVLLQAELLDGLDDP